MEEIVHMWELTIMMPHLDKDTKLQMKLKFEFWNQQVIEAGRKGIVFRVMLCFLFCFFHEKPGTNMIKFPAIDC